MGIGIDIAGRIRIPALCNGIYGFRSSVGLVPRSGVRDLTSPGTDGIRSIAGPMTNSVRDCSLFMKAVMESETWRYDSAVVSMPWKNLKVKEELRIGLIENNGMFTSSPPVRRVLQKVVDLLREREDIEIIPLVLLDMKQIYQGIKDTAITI
ncbi:putative fatty-acid amide hydrolase 1 [Venturia nashicola]|uniref:Putative fatty-acid amide hydrolase 1 n=1 Tax=Venturia nashicola TaxID=86259 RepID=A0A4Z1NVV7_9PEZI|nr:putative fatty-acid amide hydrolase 1 [Venturia nashicola]